jgi:ribosomal protein S4
MNKHFFKKKSTLSYIEKLKNRNYAITCRKNIRFFYIIERRLLVVLARLCITRIVAQDQLKFLIQNGYISVDNETIKNPYYLAPHKAIIRVLKTIPRVLSKVPKSLIINNLRWLFYKRCRRQSKKRLWQLISLRRPWFRPKKRNFRVKRIIRQPKGKNRIVFEKRKQKRPYCFGELKRRTRRYS